LIDRWKVGGDEVANWETSGKIKECPWCGGTEFRITTRETLEELYDRKGSGSMQIACKTKGCGVVMYQHQKEITEGSLDYDTRLSLLIEKWNRRFEG
jgi:hypothetical protein